MGTTVEAVSSTVITEGGRKSVVSQASCRMDVTGLERYAYIKIAILQGRNVGECHSELMEAEKDMPFLIELS
jgi:hypothetical protein